MPLSELFQRFASDVRGAETKPKLEKMSVVGSN